MRHVGLGQQPRAGRDVVDQRPPQLDHRVRLRQVDAGGARTPSRGSRWRRAGSPRRRARGSRAARRSARAASRVPHVDVDLVLAERRPRPGRRCRPAAGRSGTAAWCAAGSRARRRSPGRARRRSRRTPGRRASQPRNHGLLLEVWLATKSNIRSCSPARSATSVPGAERRVDLAVVDDREPVVGGPREHRQQVHVADHVADVVVQEPRQRVQRRLVRAPDAVAVGDQAGRPLRSAARRVRPRSRSAYVAAIATSRRQTSSCWSG